MNADFNEIESNISKNEYNIIGEGSGRIVYDLGNSYVVKAAKNMKGLAQNIVEYNIFSESNNKIFAEITDISPNKKLLIMKKAKYIKEFKTILKHYNVENINQLLKLESLKELSTKYHLTVPDLSTKTSWGIIDGIPKLIDYGLTYSVYNKYYTSDTLLLLLVFLLLKMN